MIGFFVVYPFYHTSTLKKEIKKVSFCGDGICSQDESFNNCCIDCQCISPEYCNMNTKRCQIPSIILSKDEMRKLVEEYFRDEMVYDIKFGGVTVFNDEAVKIVIINVSSEIGPVIKIIGITNDKKLYLISS